MLSLAPLRLLVATQNERKRELSPEVGNDGYQQRAA
jgi:hypothetical protein